MGIDITASELLVYAVGALLTILAWIGQHVISSLKDLTAEVKTLNATMVKMDRDLREDINSVANMSRDNTSSLSDRVTRVEERCDAFEKGRAHTCPHNETLVKLASGQ